MSGVFGITQSQDCSEEIRRGAPLLQHRGDDWGGLTVSKKGEIQAIPPKRGKLRRLLAEEGPRIRVSMGEVNTAIAHTSQKDPQPVTIEDTKMGSISVAVDGKVTNREELRERSPYLVGTDTEIIARLVASGRDPKSGLKKVYQHIKGPFSLTLLTPDGLFAARDTRGIRPLAVGRFYGDEKIGCAVASESIALEHIGMEIIRDVRPGEIIEITPTGFRPLEQIDSPGLIICGFEYAYWARPSSVIEDIPVGLSRHNAGAALASSCPKADIIASFPMSGNTAAEGLAEASGIPFRAAFDYNTEAGGRSFVPLFRATRDERARDKLLMMKWAVKGKRVIVVDDSVVEGRQAVARIYLIRMAGATEVYLMIETPKMMYPCEFDITPRGKLMAVTHSEVEMAKELGVKEVIFNTPDGFIEAVIAAQSEERKKKNPIARKNVCMGCFTGERPKY